MKYIIASLFLLLIAGSASAGTGLAFLEIPVGARENALGGAGTALITGPTSATYNPAIIAFTPRSVTLMHTRHFAETRAQFIGLNVRRGAFAFSPHYWGTRVSGIEYRLQPTREPISTFDARDATVGAALAYRLSERLSAGVTGRYIHSKIFTESSDGFAADVGVLAKDVMPHFTAGLAVNHWGHMNNYLSERPKLPTTVRGGVTYERPMEQWGTLLVTAEALGVRENTPQFRGGLEYRAPDYAAVRLGWVEGLDVQDFSLGLGVFVKMVRVDYAFIPYRENLGEGHRFSLSFDL